MQSRTRNLAYPYISVPNRLSLINRICSLICHPSYGTMADTSTGLDACAPCAHGNIIPDRTSSPSSAPPSAVLLLSNARRAAARRIMRHEHCPLPTDGARDDDCREPNRLSVVRFWPESRPDFRRAPPSAISARSSRAVVIWIRAFGNNGDRSRARPHEPPPQNM